MKQITTLKFEGKASFNEEYILSNTQRPLTQFEDSLVKFAPLFDETYTVQVGKYQVARIELKERKEPDTGVLDSKTLEALPETHTEEEYETVWEDKRRELIQDTGFKNSKNPLVIIDNETNKIIITESQKVVESVSSLMLSSLQGEYENVELVKYEAPIIEKLLTNFLLDDFRNIPDPFMLGEKVEMGDKSEFEKSPKSSTIKISKEYPADKEVVTFITDKNKVAKLVEMDYDGGVKFRFTNKFEVKGIKFQEDLDFKPDEDSTNSVNFMSQYLLQLPVVFDIINSLDKQVSEVKY